MELKTSLLFRKIQKCVLINTNPFQTHRRRADNQATTGCDYRL